MNQDREVVEEDDIPEIDFSGGVRGKYYRRCQEGTKGHFSEHGDGAENAESQLIHE